MKLFEMFATLSLDTTEFESGATEAIAQSGEIEKAINSISTDNIDAEIAALDREIVSLDNEIHSLEMADIDDDIAASGKQIKSLETDIKNAEKRAAFMQNVIATAVAVGKDLAIEAVEFLWDFAGESLDYVAESGTAIGNQLKQTRKDFNITAEALKMNLGTALAPVVMKFYDLASAMTGVTSSDRVNVVMSQLDSYTFENLQAVEGNLRNIFGEFEKWDATKIEEKLSFHDMTAGLESQIEYWNEYNRVIQSLQSRGIDSDLLATYADGSQSSLAMLQNLEKATDEELETINNTYAALETARSEAAATISNAQLEVDASVDEMVGTIARLATEVSVEDAGANVFDAAQGIVDSLSDQYPNIAQWVDDINAKLSTLGIAVRVSSSGEEHGGGGGRRFAVGMDYVPADDYPALLHEGEAVLTKAEATAWRRGETTAAPQGIDYDRLGRSVAAAMAGVTVAMDKVTVGRMVTPTVNREIAKDAQKRRYG